MADAFKRFKSALTRTTGRILNAIARNAANLADRLDQQPTSSPSQQAWPTEPPPTYQQAVYGLKQGQGAARRAQQSSHWPNRSGDGLPAPKSIAPSAQQPRQSAAPIEGAAARLFTPEEFATWARQTPQELDHATSRNTSVSVPEEQQMLYAQSKYDHDLLHLADRTKSPFFDPKDNGTLDAVFAKMVQNGTGWQGVRAHFAEQVKQRGGKEALLNTIIKNRGRGLQESQISAALRRYAPQQAQANSQTLAQLYGEHTPPRRWNANGLQQVSRVSPSSGVASLQSLTPKIPQ